MNSSPSDGGGPVAAIGPAGGLNRSAGPRTPNPSERSLDTSCSFEKRHTQGSGGRRNGCWSHCHERAPRPTPKAEVRMGEPHRSRAQGSGARCRGPYKSPGGREAIRLQTDGCNPFGTCVPKARLFDQSEACRRSSASTRLARRVDAALLDFSCGLSAVAYSSGVDLK